MTFRERMILTFGVLAGIFGMLAVIALARGENVVAIFILLGAMLVGWFGTTARGSH